MDGFDREALVVIGGSAGSLGPLRQIITGLPGDLAATVCVAIHLPADSPSALARVLATAGQLPAAFAADGAPLVPSTIQVAPPGHHLLVDGDRLVLSRGARENHARPAIDPLFRSAAAHHGPRVISLLLSGTLDDGAAGTAAVARAGGVTMVQDPVDAQFPDMPRNALATGTVRHVLAGRRIARVLEDLVQAVRAIDPQPSARSAVAVGAAGAGRLDNAPPNDPATDRPVGDPAADPVQRGLVGPAPDLEPPASPYGCPACGGVLYERQPPLQYLCRLGHR